MQCHRMHNRPKRGQKVPKCAFKMCQKAVILVLLSAGCPYICPLNSSLSAVCLYIYHCQQVIHIFITVSMLFLYLSLSVGCLCIHQFQQVSFIYKKSCLYVNNGQQVFCILITVSRLSLYLSLPAYRLSIYHC